VYGDGSQTRSFCYVDDLVEGIQLLFHADRVEPTDIGNPDEFTVRELADAVLQLIGSSSTIEHRPLPEDDPQVRQPDFSEAREHLRWEPKVPLDEGLEKALPYFTSQVA